MEADLTVDVPDKLLDLDNELSTSDSLLFSCEDYPISELLFDTTDNQLTEDMYRSSVFDGASTEIDGGSRFGSNTNTATPPFRPGAPDSNPGASNQLFPQEPLTEKSGGLDSLQPYPASGFAMYSTAGAVQGREGNDHQDYGRQSLPLEDDGATINVGAGPSTYQPPPAMNFSPTMMCAPVNSLREIVHHVEPVEPPAREWEPRIAEVHQPVPWGNNAPIRQPVHAIRDMLSIPPKERPPNPEHVCKICKKTFKRGHNLKIHQRLHTGDHPYACPFQGCSKEYKWKSSIVSHINWHLRKKNDRIQGYDTVSSLVNLGKQVKFFRERSVPMPMGAVQAGRVTRALGSGGRAARPNTWQTSTVDDGNAATLSYLPSGVLLELPRLQPLREGPMLASANEVAAAPMANLPGMSSLGFSMGRREAYEPFRAEVQSGNGQEKWQTQDRRLPQEGRLTQERRQAQERWSAQERWRTQENRQAQQDWYTQAGRSAEYVPQARTAGGVHRLPSFNDVRETVVAARPETTRSCSSSRSCGSESAGMQPQQSPPPSAAAVSAAESAYRIAACDLVQSCSPPGASPPGASPPGALPPSASPPSASPYGALRRWSGERGAAGAAGSMEGGLGSAAAAGGMEAFGASLERRLYDAGDAGDAGDAAPGWREGDSEW